MENRFVHDINVEKDSSTDSLRAQVVICCSDQAFITDVKGNLNYTTNFGFAGSSIALFNTFPKTSIWYLNRGGGWQPVSVYDKAGKCLWSYGNHEKDETPDNMAGGDINGDGTPEFAIGCNGGIITCLDKEGKSLWRQSSKGTWHTEIIDIDGDGKGEIVHSDADGLMVVRNQKGEIVNTRKLPFYLTEFNLINWPNARSATQFLIAGAFYKIYVIDPKDGKIVASFDAPRALTNYIQGTFVHFANNTKPYLAVVVMIKATWQRSILFIYSPEGALIYQEILATYYPALTTLPGNRAGVESLLVGGPGVVWKYDLLAK